jgi:lysophospholipase L1-like esterase
VGVRRVGLALGFLVLLLLASEVALRFGAGRAGEGSWTPGASFRLLCLGDSLPFGSRVRAEEAFPAQLQRLLEQRSPGRYSIVNLAVPGMNSSQVRRRLPRRVLRYEPDLVIVMAGANNARNDAEMEEAPPPAWRERLDGLASRSALYRALRLRALAGLPAPGAPTTRADGRRQVAEVEGCPEADCEVRARWRLSHGGEVEVIEMVRVARPDRERAARRAAADYLSLQRWLDGAGIPLVLVGYPRDFAPPFAVPNRALRRVAREHGLRVVDTRPAAARAGGRWPDTLHPNPAVHVEIARELLPVVEALAAGRAGTGHP